MSLTRAFALTLLGAATAAVFWPVLQNGFVNWDDVQVLTGNEALSARGLALVTWAFSSGHMNHYQPLSWLAYAALHDGDASQVHAVSLALHVVNVLLLTWLAARIASADDGDDTAWWAAAAATALFAVHPLRVEPVAWASALPYLLSYAPLLAAMGAWLTWLRDDRRSGAWWAALGLYTVSQLARVTAPLLPVVLFLLGRADHRARPRTAQALAMAAAPFALVAAPLAWLEASVRNVESLSDFGLELRLLWTAQHPGLYLWRTLAPRDLSPLDVLPRAPHPDAGLAIMAVIGLAIIVAFTRHLSSWRTVGAVWGGYLLLLLPVLGLTPSGLQVTADRYTYGPAMVLTIALTVLLTKAPSPVRRVGFAAAGAAAVFLGQAAMAQTSYWRDSVTLWTRAVALNADNDVAIFNLAQALVSAGLPDAAIPQYERVVALVPDHEPAKRALASVQAGKAQAQADADAAAGRLAQAVRGYDRVLALDPGRRQARLNRGMARVGLGDVAGGVPDLEAAVQAGNQDPEVASALAFGWVTLGRAADAIALLRRTQAAHPDDIGLANNLARLLLTADPPSLRDPKTALDIAAQINQMNGAQDPRLLDTLAMALAATGSPATARQALERAVTLARDAGDRDLAADLTARLNALPR